MTSTRPYLLRAIYAWIVDNGLTPHLLVETADARVRVPTQYVENGAIVLNTAPSAVRDLDLGNEFVSFSARFAGTPHSIVVPLGSVQAIYAKENGQGIFLGDADRTTAGPNDNAREAETQSVDGESLPARAKGPHLTIVK